MQTATPNIDGAGGWAWSLLAQTPVADDDGGVTGAIHEALVKFGQWVGVEPTTLINILWTVGIVVLYVVVRKVLVYVVSRRTQDVSRRYIASKTITYLLGLLAVVALLRVWLATTAGALATYLGILSAGLAIALQDPVTNLAGWLYIVIRKPFGTGDRIQIGPHAGDVVDISLFQFSVVEIGNWVDADQSTGRLIHIPNGWVFKQTTGNYTQGFNFIWNELPVTVTFESNWAEAKEILARIATEHSAVRSEYVAKQIRNAARKFMIFYEHLTPIVWTHVADIGVTLTVRYLCQPRTRRSSAARIWEEILREFAQRDDIDFAYPTMRYYDNAVEGKPPLRPNGKPSPSPPPPNEG